MNMNKAKSLDFMGISELNNIMTPVDSEKSKGAIRPITETSSTVIDVFQLLDAAESALPSCGECTIRRRDANHLIIEWFFLLGENPETYSRIIPVSAIRNGRADIIKHQIYKASTEMKEAFDKKSNSKE